MIKCVMSLRGSVVGPNYSVLGMLCLGMSCPCQYDPAGLLGELGFPIPHGTAICSDILECVVGGVLR
jgi:hypothetical protein